MCHFMTATMAAEDGNRPVAEVVKRFGRVWQLIENDHVKAQLLEDELYVFTTGGHCDCGTSQLIPSIFEESGARRVGLLLHWYRGDLTSERMSITRRERVSAAGLSAEFFGRIEADVLYDFTT